MSYHLKSITIRTNNSQESIKRIAEIWQDVLNGRLPLLFDNENIFQKGISPISAYSNYESDETGDFDLSIIAVTSDFFEQMERKIALKKYKKIDISDENGDLQLCTLNAWKKVWQEQKEGLIKRAFTTDYESTVPKEYTKDGKAHCYLWIALKE